MEEDRDADSQDAESQDAEGQDTDGQDAEGQNAEGRGASGLGAGGALASLSGALPSSAVSEAKRPPQESICGLVCETDLEGPRRGPQTTAGPSWPGVLSWPSGV